LLRLRRRDTRLALGSSLTFGLRVLTGARLRAGVAAVSMSSPNSSDRSSSARTFLLLLAFFDRGRPAPARATNSLSSTWRRRNSNSGLASKRAPTPYRAAATCLHITAQSGQLHEKLSSLGAGNSPVPCRQMRSIDRK